ncbi:hypothetical protein [Pseudomonas petrae]|uniref:Uncharacterized protein n=1 Tax=Pseudomonas petrae TaxID=2912190 RepID=A0ABS9I5R9_9PSED|nr:hypothetical protein [Pseudomonas petrae]MCF7532278.1 hypothetical protein [Pseudomonas petrae]MCF7535909.1 hypothetical protein [Pseudomonas petrae]MCF7542771.1 hypothetical protein [Pseudomonas petrae]MCF7554973.1 hypothetical protein [Pseudomonas petrae]
MDAKLVSWVQDMKRGTLMPGLIFKGATGKGGDAVSTPVCRLGKKSSKTNGFMGRTKNTAPSIRKSVATAKSEERRPMIRYRFFCQNMQAVRYVVNFIHKPSPLKGDELSSKSGYSCLTHALHPLRTTLDVLEIPDDFQYMDPELVELLESAVSEYLER